MARLAEDTNGASPLETAGAPESRFETAPTRAHRLCVAPMMERTDRHCRYLLRLISPRAWLYTEMVTAAAVLHGDREALLGFDAAEHPVALQLGGNDPVQLAAAARAGAAAGYDEINLNVGCPSGRVQAGCFGAALMRAPATVARCVAAMQDAAGVPVTVKTRLGVDDDDSYAFVHAFVAHVVASGCRTVIVHARKAWLEGLSPKENREIPPLRYADVHRLKRDFPAVEILVNGGLSDADAAARECTRVDGVMLGRAVYRDPMLLGAIEQRLFGDAAAPQRIAVAAAYIRYMERELARGTPLRAMTRHLMGLYAARPGGRRWRRALGELRPGPRWRQHLEAALPA